MDKLDALKAAEAKQHQALLKQQQALHKAQLARKQEEQRQNARRWQLAGQAFEKALQLPPLVHLSPEQVFDIWELVAQFFQDPSLCDIQRDLLKIRATFVPDLFA